jgi:hypothetical protein
MSLFLFFDNFDGLLLIVLKFNKKKGTKNAPSLNSKL